MPSRMPLPARRIDTKHSFLPSKQRRLVVSSGVSIVDRLGRQVARDLVGHQQADLAQQPAELVVAVSLRRISVSLCCTSGMVDDGHVADAASAVLRGRFARLRIPCRRCAHSGGAPSARRSRRRSAGRRPRCRLRAPRRAAARRRSAPGGRARSGASSSSSATVSARHSTIDRRRPASGVAASAGSRSRSTPMSSSSPPLRYSGRPVSASRPSTVTPAHSNGSSSE